MFRIASPFAALAVLLAVAIPANAAVKIAPALELELPDFMPDVKQGTIIVLDQRADWPAVR